MNTSHTPGPWEMCRMRLGPRVKDRRSGFVVNGPEPVDEEEYLPVRVCDMRCDRDKGFEETQANARLISAAPELLSLVRTYWQSKSEESWLREEPEIHAAIVAAIAKAEGSELS